MNAKTFERALQLCVLLFLMMTLFTLACRAQPAQRIMLTQLEQSKTVEGTKAGQIGLTNAAGDQRYAQYVEISATPIVYVPTPTGNLNNLSEFVEDSLSRIWYIDWQGNAVLLNDPATCDQDWLRISDNGCPEALTDSLYKYKYASIGARYVWPNAELLVSDSVAVGQAVISGDRNARLVLHDNENVKESVLDQGGAQTTLYIESTAESGVFQIATSTGTQGTPFIQTRHFGVNAADSTLQFFQYPDTRQDDEAVNNLLYTDNTGKVRSTHVDSVLAMAGNGIYGGSDTVPEGTLAFIPEGSGGKAEFAFGDFPSWPDINQDGTEKGLFYSPGYWGGMGIYYDALFIDMTSTGITSFIENSSTSVTHQFRQSGITDFIAYDGSAGFPKSRSRKVFRTGMWQSTVLSGDGSGGDAGYIRVAMTPIGADTVVIVSIGYDNSVNNEDGSGSRVIAIRCEDSTSNNISLYGYKYKLPNATPTATSNIKNYMTWTGNGTTTTPSFNEVGFSWDTAITDGSGDITVTHFLPDDTFSATVTIEGTSPYFATIHSKTATTFKIRVFNSSTGAAVTATSITFNWIGYDFP